MLKHTRFSKDFLLVAVGQIISIFGNQILRYALPLYLLKQTGSAALFGTILALSFLPMLILFPIGGIIADRVNKRNIMVILDFGTAILIFAFYSLAGRLDIVPLMAVTMILLYGIQGVYQPAVKASVPALVPAEQIMQANSIVDTINSIASMAGPVIGGLLLSLLGLTPILYLSIICFLASSILELFIHIPFDQKPAAGGIFATGLEDLEESFRFIFQKQPILWKISSLFAASNLLLTSLMIIALPVLITQRLGFAPGMADRLYGYAQGAVAAGAVAGGLLAGIFANKLQSKSSPLLLTGCSLCILAEGLALKFFSQPFEIYAMLLICSCLLLTLHTLFQIQMMTYLQLLTPAHLIGKVISCFMCIVMCTNPLGQLLYGFIFDQIGGSVYWLFVLTSVIMIIISVRTRHMFDHISPKERLGEKNA